MSRKKRKRGKKEKQELARKRAEMILKVRNGEMTATEAAKALGVSRKTYYEWENRALEAMMGALTNRNPGRPKLPEEDPEKAALQKRVAELELDLKLTTFKMEIKELLGQITDGDDGSVAAEQAAADRSAKKKIKKQDKKS